MGDDVADAVRRLRVGRGVEARRRDLLEFVGAGGEFEEFDEQGQATEPVGFRHLVQERGRLLAGRPFEFEAEARPFQQAADGGDGGVLRPVVAEEVRAELDEDPLDAGLTAFPVVAEIVGKVGAEEQDLADLERGHLVADPALGAAAEQEEDLMLGMVMPDAAKIALAQVLAGDEFVRRGGRLLFFDQPHRVRLSTRSKRLRVIRCTRSSGPCGRDQCDQGRTWPGGVDSPCAQKIDEALKTKFPFGPG